MIFSYLKLGIRRMADNPFFTLINVSGLAAGLAVFFILWQYSQSELHSDHFIQDYTTIYRACTASRTADDKMNWIEKTVAVSPYAADDVISKYESIAGKTFFIPQLLFADDYIPDHGSEIQFTYTNKINSAHTFVENNVIYAAPNFFQFFSIPFLKGDITTALADVDAMVISKRIAVKYFGDADPIGQLLLLNDKTAFVVTGVFQDLPPNSHLSLDIALSFNRIETSLESLYRKGRSRFHPFCYYKFPRNADVKKLERTLHQEAHDAITQLVYVNTPFAEADLLFQRIDQISFESLTADTHIQRSKYFLTTLSVGALVILVMAWINTVNLTLSFNRKRLSEIFVRKAVGAGLRNLVAQFFVESVLLNATALAAALTLVQILKGALREYLNIYVVPFEQLHYTTLAIGLGALAISVLVSAFFPCLAFLRQSTKDLVSWRSGKSFSGHLNVVQFTIAVIFIIWTFTIQSQYNFILNKDLGIDRDHLLLVDLPFVHSDIFESQVEAFNNRLQSEAGIVGASACYTISADLPEARVQLLREEGVPWVSLDCNSVDENFISLLKIEMLAGRNFRGDVGSDRGGVLLSRAAAERLGFGSPQQAIGFRIFNAAGLTFGSEGSEVIGVYEDYNMRPMLSSYTNRLPGTVLIYKNYLKQRFLPRKVAVKVHGVSVTQAIGTVGNAFNETFPQQLFSWSFFDEYVEAQYKMQATGRNQLMAFTLVAIGIACLGLLGMIRHRAASHLKEIGVRKVLGAELHHIAGILLSSTAKQSLVASIAGIPIAYLLTQQYLDTFAERIDLHWWHYAIPLALLGGIMITTIGSVIWRAAHSNAVDALKHE